MAGGGLLTSNTLTCSSTPLPLLRILVIPSGPLGLSRIIYLKVSWRHRAGTWTQQGRRAGTSWGQHWHLHTATREAEPVGARCDHGGAGPGAGIQRGGDTGMRTAEPLHCTAEIAWKAIIFPPKPTIFPQIYILYKKNSVDYKLNSILLNS